MKFEQYGNPLNPKIILIHGGGLSSWIWRRQINTLSGEFHIITPIIDGHGDDFGTEFVSIKNSAEKIISYIDTEFDVNVFAIGGLSLGAQIAVEILSLRGNIAKKAIIESALVIPAKWVSKFSKIMYAVSFPLVKNKSFSWSQAKSINIPEQDFENYYQDSIRMTKQSFNNMMISNGEYHLRDDFKNCSADIMVICGDKELSIMKKSSRLLARSNDNCHLVIIPKSAHGFSIRFADDYIKLIKEFLV